MKKLIVALAVLVLLGSSCGSNRGSKIFRDHAKEKNKFRINKKFKPAKNCKSWK